MPNDTDASRQHPRVLDDAVLPPDARLNALGELFERARLESGLTQDAFLREHGMGKRTWWRLLYGLLADNDKAPSMTTIVRYARAAGVDEDKARALAQELFDPQPVRPLTPLGQALERCRLHAGEYTREFLKQRRLTVSTWYRLLHGGDRPPRRETVIKYASAVGLDPDRALALAGLASESAQLASAAQQGDATNLTLTSGNTSEPASEDTDISRR